jgi:hypothetical protein
LRKQESKDLSLPNLWFGDEAMPQTRTHRRHRSYTDEDIPTIREQWRHRCSTYFDNRPDRLPPLQEINHRIPLIDEGK